MGLLDIPGLALTWIDGLIDGLLSDPLRIALWSVLGGIVCMVIYGRISRQSELTALKREARDARAALASYDGDFDGMLAIARDNLRLSLRRFWLSLLPAVAASLPLLVLAVWMSGSFAYDEPKDGQEIPIEADIRTAPGTPGRNDTVHWTVKWSETDGVKLHGPHGAVLAELRPGSISHVIYPRSSWNLLVGNPGGYLKPEGSIAEIRVGLQSTRHIDGVPAWMGGWEFLFIVTVMASSLLAKHWLRLH